MNEAVERARAYADAGADGFFAPGLQDLVLIKELAAQAPIPLNVMVLDLESDLKLYVSCGVSRISFGPAPYVTAMKAVQDIADRGQNV